MKRQAMILMLAFLVGSLAGRPQAELHPPAARSHDTEKPARPSSTRGISKIEHVVWIIQENRSFDNYFGTYPGAEGIPPGTCLPKLPGSSECIASFHMPQTVPPCDLSHHWNVAHAAYDHGAMDGFVWAEGTPFTMGYYDDRDIPNYWDYARHYTLADRFFSSLNGPSLPNHLYTVAAQSGGITTNIGSVQQIEDLMDDDEGFSFPSMVNLFVQSNISWKYYIETQPMPPGQKASLYYPNPKEFSIWNPLVAFGKVRNDPALMAHLVSQDEYFKDLQQGTLPQASWLIPDMQDSEHPPEPIAQGMWYVTKLINALMQSRYYASTVIFLTWDDYGGFYDHVPPRQLDAFGYGPRVPLLIISPYAKANYITNQTGDFTSMLRFMEERWGLGHLTVRDGRASDLHDAFDFNQAPLPPLIIPIPPHLESHNVDHNGCGEYPPYVPIADDPPNAVKGRAGDQGMKK